VAQCSIYLIGGDGLNEQEDLRTQAVTRIKKKRQFVRNIVIYLLVNAGLWVIWAFDGADTGDLWPAIVSGIWGAVLVFDAFKVYGERPISEREIEEEMRRITRD
jgi:hypothetical protein